MSKPTHRFGLFFKILGISSPYLAVLLGVFLLKNGFGAVVFYHLVLFVCVAAINKSNAMKLLSKGFQRYPDLLICLTGLVPGVIILYLWPIAKLEQVDLSQTLAMLNLDSQLFKLFAVYACLVNPFLEESFWRGCFKNDTRWPSFVDVLFAGYHGLAVFPVLNTGFVLFIFAAMVFVGWIFRTLYRVTGGLLIPLVTHIIADIAILWALWKIIS